MSRYHHPATRWVASLALAFSLALSGTPAVLANVGDVNSTNNGQNVAGGTYFNTPTGATTFINSGHTGLYVKAGDTVVGREVNPITLQQTGNGGNLHQGNA